MIRDSSWSPSASTYSSVTDTKEDRAKKACEGLAKELELPLPEIKAIVGADGFFLSWLGSGDRSRWT